MDPTTVILITGHPATGKTTLAHSLAQALHLPLLYRDGLKETLADTLGWSTEEWSLKLGAATWELLYHLVETLLRANVSHIVESNFSPTHATGRWQQLCERYGVRIIQLRCEADPALIITRFHARVEKGNGIPSIVIPRIQPAIAKCWSKGRPIGSTCQENVLRLTPVNLNQLPINQSWCSYRNYSNRKVHHDDTNATPRHFLLFLLALYPGEDAL